MISVIVPVYNVEKYLKRCIDSILNQTYSNLELLLVDDGSTDNSSSICDEYARNDIRVKVIHKKNGGQASARNVALDIAKGDYISFIDSDDWLELNMYESMLNILQRTNADCVASGVNQVYLDRVVPTTSGDSSYCVLHQQAAFSSLFSSDSNIRFELWNKLFKKEALVDVRFKEGQLHEEVYFTRMAFLNISAVVYLHKNLYNYVVEREGNTNSSFKQSRLFVFSELNDFAKMLYSMRYEDVAKDCERFALNMSVTLYYRAKECKAPNDILFQIKHFFNIYYENNKFLRGFKTCLFYYAPNFYIALGKTMRYILPK